MTRNQYTEKIRRALVASGKTRAKALRDVAERYTTESEARR